jgi:hypothetical protein
MDHTVGMTFHPKIKYNHPSPVYGVMDINYTTGIDRMFQFKKTIMLGMVLIGISQPLLAATKHHHHSVKPIHHSNSHAHHVRSKHSTHKAVHHVAKHQNVVIQRSWMPPP